MTGLAVVNQPPLGCAYRDQVLGNRITGCDPDPGLTYWLHKGMEGKNGPRQQQTYGAEQN